jgi:hypothetical protein
MKTSTLRAAFFYPTEEGHTSLRNFYRYLFPNILYARRNRFNRAHLSIGHLSL